MVIMAVGDDCMFVKSNLPKVDKCWANSPERCQTTRIHKHEDDLKTDKILCWATKHTLGINRCAN
jgi:hypothetical protein